jgi:Na+/H+ antiporter NhaC
MITIFLLASVIAIILSRGNLSHRLRVFARGAGRDTLLLMIWIFILAGAFANSAKEMGSIADMVNLTLAIVPSSAILAGLFLGATVISLSIGTSVGTIVAMMPIAVGIAQQLEESVPFVAAIIIGGAFFGDNLSFISDTTICATQSQGCKMSDKFRTNIRIALPAAILVFIFYVFIGKDMSSPAIVGEINFWKVMPYLVVLITAIAGMNVLIVLVVGILLTGIVGMINGDYTILSWSDAMGAGVVGMGELIIITMLAGGLLEVIRANGGIKFIMDKILRHVHSQRTAELSIAAMVSVVDMFTANNTVAIITVAGLAKDISIRYHLDNRRVASILDTFSCIMQGIIPYGAQLLMGAALAGIASVDIIPYLYYPYVLALFAIGNIIFRAREYR